MIGHSEKCRVSTFHWTSGPETSRFSEIKFQVFPHNQRLSIYHYIITQSYNCLIRCLYYGHVSSQYFEIYDSSILYCNLLDSLGRTRCCQCHRFIFLPRGIPPSNFNIVTAAHRCPPERLFQSSPGPWSACQEPLTSVYFKNKTKANSVLYIISLHYVTKISILF